MPVLSSIRNDIKAARERDPAARNALDVILTYPGFHARQIHRLTNALHHARVPFLPKLVAYAGRFLTGIEIHPGARIGAGSVVLTNVPAYATVVGVPGKVVAYYDSGNETTVRLPDPEWDRLEELNQRLDELRTQVQRLEEELAAHRRESTGVQGATTP